jgi:GrpB-like predicted nucleotidyltransferase (UPF0157 family)
MLLQHYQERWANDFKEIEKVIGEAFSKTDVSVVHVGSTSVPELAAKPIIDIDVVYGPGVEFNEVKDRLEKIGYRHNGNQGIKEREVFKRRKMTKSTKFWTPSVITFMCVPCTVKNLVSICCSGTS